MIIQPQDLYTELYPEVVSEITRGDLEEVKTQIKAAQDYVKAYLFRYDLDKLFGVDDAAPEVEDENLKKIVKILATYWLVKKASPGANLENYLTDMEMMIGSSRYPGWLINIRDGKSNPDWPYRPDDPGTPADESNIHGSVYASHNIKRIQSF